MYYKLHGNIINEKSDILEVISYRAREYFTFIFKHKKGKITKISPK